MVMNGGKIQDKPTEHGILSKTLKVAAYPIAAIAGYLVVAHDTLQSVYDDIKGPKDKGLRGAYEAEKNRLVKLGKEAAANHTAPSEDIAAKKNILNKTYNRQINTELKEMGLGSTIKRWNWIHPGDRRQALFRGIEAGAIVLGAVLLVSSSKLVTEMFKKNDSEKKNDGPSV
jgi:hypothetical protein